MKKTIGSITFEVTQDDCSESPCDWLSSKFYTWHRNYVIGESIAKMEMDAFKEYLENNGIEAALILPLYILDHGGITISTKPFNDRFDSGMVGYVLLSKEEHESLNIHVTESVSIQEIIESDVDTLDSYLRGEVYQYSVSRDDILLDSGFGYYSFEEAESEAKAQAESYSEAYDVSRERFQDGFLSVCV